MLRRRPYFEGEVMDAGSGRTRTEQRQPQHHHSKSGGKAAGRHLYSNISILFPRHFRERGALGRSRDQRWAGLLGTHPAGGPASRPSRALPEMPARVPAVPADHVTSPGPPCAELGSGFVLAARPWERR